MKRLLAVLIGLLIPTSAFAVRLRDFGFDCAGFLYCDKPGNAVTILAARVITIVNIVIIPLAVLAMVYGGLRMVMTSVNEEGKEAGKKTLMYAALGLVLAILAERIILYVITIIYAIGA